MVFQFRLPDVGEGIDAAEIMHWHVAVGDHVREDQPLVDIQTDKAIVEIPVPTDGIVLQLCGEVGDSIPVGDLLAEFDGASEQPLPAEAAVAVPVAPSEPEPAEAHGRALASPTVRKQARDLGIDLSSVAGSGPGGRVLLEDLLSASSTTAPAVVPTQVQGSPAVIGRESTREPLRGIRRVIAKNMTVAWQSTPHIIDYREIDASALIEARKQLRKQAEARDDNELASAMTMLPILAKIAATVVRRHPSVNSSIDMVREEITRHHAVNLSIPVNGPDGLMTPVIRDAGRLTVGQIAIAIVQLSVAARSRRLTVDQLSGGTVTVNNFGALGSRFSTPIIPPGQAVNIGFGRIEDRAVVRSGEIVIRPILGLSCSGDHRLLDGVDLAGFVNELVAAIENPVLLLADLA